MVIRVKPANASTPKLTFTPLQILVKEESNFTVQAQILDSPPFTMFWIIIAYNPTFIDALNATTWPDGYINIDKEQGKIDVSATTTQSLQGNQTLATITFKAVQSGNTTLQFESSEIYDPQLNPITHIAETAQVEIVGPLNLAIAYSQPIYLEQYLTIYANLTMKETPINSLLGVEIVSPKNTTVMTRVLGSVTGDYPIQILTFYPSDQYGNPKNTFTVNYQAYFTTRVQNLKNETLPILIVINVLDRYDTPIGFTICQTSIYRLSELLFIGPVLIRDYAFNGTAKAYINIFSEWPRNWGIPYCREESVTFQIINGVTKTPLFIPSDNPIKAQYNLTLRLPLSTGKGNYTIYATSTYKVQNAYNTTTLQARLICDFNNDGKVGPYDFTIFALSYGSTQKDPNWLPEADYDKNQKIGPYDFTVLAINYGKYVK